MSGPLIFNPASHTLLHTSIIFIHQINARVPDRLQTAI